MTDGQPVPGAGLSRRRSRAAPFKELPGAADAQAEAFFTHEGAAAVDDAVAGRVVRLGTVPRKRVGK